jgi:hypothetical protein
MELVGEVADWEVRLSMSDESGLKEALRTFQTSLHIDFAEYVKINYPKWLYSPEGDRPPLSVDVCSEFLVPLLRNHPGVLFVVVDCLRLDQWGSLTPLVTNIFDVEESHYFSILPSATPFARNAIFSGLFPVEIAARHPEWWGPRDDESLNAHEAELLAEQLQELMGTEIPVHYEKLSSATESEALLQRLPAYLSRGGVTALVFNFVDQLTHGRAEHAILYEVARDTNALRSLTSTVTAQPRYMPSEMPQRTCGTSSERTFVPTRRRMPSLLRTCRAGACRRRGSVSECCSRRVTGSSCIRQSSASIRLGTEDRSCTAV